MLLFVIFVVALLPRILQLDAFISPDEPRWLENTLGFREGLATGNFSSLYQQPHPGITNMWITAATITSDSWATRRAPLAIVLAVLIMFSTYIMARCWGWGAGFGGGLLLALDPLFIAHSRVLAMDALLSIFLLLAVLTILAWLQERKWYWLALSGIAASLAVLSKMIGVVVVGVVPLVLIWDQIRQKRFDVRMWGIWLGALILTTMMVFPTLLTDFGKVAAGTKEFFATEHYSQQVHALGPWWYPQAFLLWTTPLQLVGLASLPFLFWKVKKMSKVSLAILGGFALIFFFAIQYSIKKGDRYMLPDFLLFNVIAALGLSAIPTLRSRIVKWVGIGLVIAVAGWQVMNIFQLHPYYLAYRNPFFRNIAQGRTMGWGEGLDLAAYYLNEKPDAKEMLVVSYYESSFAQHFVGQVTSAERLGKETLEEIDGDYVVLYRTMQGRAPERWETKVLTDFASKTPEKVISLNGEEYVWIYKVK